MNQATLKPEILQVTSQAKAASYQLASLSSKQKNKILEAMAKNLENQADQIQSENEKDLIEAKKNKLTQAMVDRLTLNLDRVQAMANGLRELIKLPDPVGHVLEQNKRPNGLLIKKVSVPIGVIAIIFESRPNVTADAAALCFKSGNAVILRGGKEAIHSNRCIANILTEAGKKEGLPPHAIQLIDTTDRKAVEYLVQAVEHVDLVIPRGGESLIKAVAKLSHVPVIKHYKGNCHIFVDQDADQKMAMDICINAKCQRPGVCNAIETLLVHQDIVDEFLPKLIPKLQEQGVEIRADEYIFNLAKKLKLPQEVKRATEDDWHEEYLDLILAIKSIKDVDEAIKHINHYGSHHSESIISNTIKNVEKFLNEVDSSSVYHNASTRFTDGQEFGLGAEIGISTDKLHARGPMGLKELTTYKYHLLGTGQIRN